MSEQICAKDRMLDQLTTNKSIHSPTKARPDLKNVEEMTLVTKLKLMVKQLQSANQQQANELSTL